jgi:putative ABC transport system substrate-binding protein
MRRIRSGALVVGLVLTSAGVLTSAIAAPPARLIKIGALTESWGPPPAIIGLRQGLVELGYRESKDFVIGVRFTQGDPAELSPAAAELVRHGVDLIVTSEAGNAAKAARAATSRIPIVFIGGADPVKLGLVQSLAHPGGNVTGIADLDLDLIPKRLEIFQQLMPGLKRVLLPYDATSDYALGELEAFRTAVRRFGLTLVEKPLRTQDQARMVIAGIRRDDVDGIVSPRSVSLNIPGFILEAALRHAIPAMFRTSFFVEQGGLISYAPNQQALGRQAARLVDKILKGINPATLPVEQATTFDLVINLKTAKALGVTIPQSLLLRADHLIE